jgi:hypothetical protein
LYAIVQSPLLQDHALDEHNKRIGTNLRILEITLESGRTRELLYQLDSSELCVNEMLAVNEHEFLVIERDRRIGAAARDKRVVRIDIGGASDISGIASLPAAGTPEGVTPVTKAPFIDLLSPAFGLAGADMPEKIEGLAFGPDLPDGRRLLIVTTDNDLKANEPTCFYLFAIDARDLAGFRAQRFAQGSH